MCFDCGVSVSSGSAAQLSASGHDEKRATWARVVPLLALPGVLSCACSLARAASHAYIECVILSCVEWNEQFLCGRVLRCSRCGRVALQVVCSWARSTSRLARGLLHHYQDQLHFLLHELLLGCQGRARHPPSTRSHSRCTFCALFALQRLCETGHLLVLRAHHFARPTAIDSLCSCI
jgi:hypothetical protein